MNLDRTDLDAAVAEQILTREKADRLLKFFQDRPQQGRFTGINVA